MLLPQMPSFDSMRDQVLGGVLKSRFVAALAAPHGVDAYLQLGDAQWSVSRVLCRIVEIRRETTHAVSLWLQPNTNWGGFVPGQFVQMTVRIGGVRHTRSFSLSSARGSGAALRITVKAFDAGRVSTWANRDARVGEVVELSQAMGQFVIPQPAPARMLFISAGSGVTPIMSMLEQLLADGHRGPLISLHYARQEAIFGDALAALAAEHAGLQCVSYVNGDARHAPGGRLRFSRERLEALVPDWNEWETFLCGPASLEHDVMQLWQSAGVLHRLHIERFRIADTVQLSSLRGRHPGRHSIHFAKAGIQIDGQSGPSLLEQAERAGLTPAYGCRMGICLSCRCTKLSGRVHNVLTERESDETDEIIQLCINTPVSDVVLDL